MLDQLYSLLGWHSLRLVASPPLKGEAYDGPHSRLYHSGFNLNWLAELGVRAPGVLIDVGSFDGGDAYRFRRFSPGSRVIAIEADPTRAEILRSNLASTGVEIVEAAVCDRDGLVDWYPATINGTVDGQGSIYRHTDRLNRKFPFVKQSENPITVQGRRLDEICSSLGIASIDLLHMDIQGAEFVALQGLGKMRPSVIYLETMRVNGWIGSGGKKESTALLRRRGYRLAADLHGDRLYAL